MKPILETLVPSPTLHPDSVARPGANEEHAGEVGVLDDAQLMLVGGGDGVPCW